MATRANWTRNSDAMTQSATLPTGGGNPVSGLPLPVKLGLIGGGLGLAVFIWKRNAGGGSTDETDAFGIPNTAIMLGSLQQGLLDLKGEVGYGTVTISDLVSGGFENLGAQIDAQTATWQQGLGVLQDNIINNSNANTKTIVDSLKLGTDALSTLIGNNAAAQKAINESILNSLVNGFDAITTFHNAEMAGIGALGNNITAGQSAIIDRLKGVDTTLAGIAAGVAAGNLPKEVLPSLDWNMFNGKKIFSEADQGWYTVIDGVVKSVSFWDTVPGRPFGDQVPQINVKQSLKGISKGAYQAPN
jgi:hypothetical protein